MDIGLVDNETGVDMQIIDNEIGIDNSLQTAVFISLFTDRRAFFEGKERKGYWGDSLENEEPLGSKLWTLERSKITPETVFLAREYAQEALQWLIEKRLAKSVEVDASVEQKNMLVLTIKIQLANDEYELYRYDLGGN